MGATKDIIYSEQELVIFLKENNRVVFNYLYDSYSGSLFLVIDKITKDFHTSEDVLQDVFVKIWRKMHLYDPHKGAFYTWMRNIACNAAIDSLRSTGERMKHKTRSENVLLNTFAKSATQTDLIGIKTMLFKLRPECQGILKLIYMEGLTIREVAAFLKTPEGTIKTRLRASLKLLRSNFQYMGLELSVSGSIKDGL